MKLAANAYAIGPSLHNWECEEWEEQEIKAEIIDQRFDDYFRAWKSLNYSDMGCVFTQPKKLKMVKEEINDVVSLAQSNMAWNKEDSKEFNLLLFKVYCSGENSEAINAIFELLDKYIKPACRELMRDAWQSW